MSNINDFESRLAEMVNTATDTIRQRVAAAVAPAPRVQIPMPALEGLAKALVPFQSALERLDAMMPGNWRGERLAYADMVRLMQEGVPLAWVPPADVIRQLLGASDASSRSKVIDDCRPEILAACGETLEAASDARLTVQRALLEECVRMAERGMFSGAQALAANVWDTLVRGLAFANRDWLTDSGWWSYKKIKQSIPTVDDDDATFGELRTAAVFLPFAKTLDAFQHPQPVPGSFNRHATAHATGNVQYTAANATTALMLAVSVLREIDDQGYHVQIHA
ncbi:hypothetical protein [Streptomyces platensis]|uniref:hypothetical protein n=1 Tax=Streptomyces platensis TaxID=58346 RepID=UPI0037A84646